MNGTGPRGRGEAVVAGLRLVAVSAAQLRPSPRFRHATSYRTVGRMSVVGSTVRSRRYDDF